MGRRVLSPRPRPALPPRNDLKSVDTDCLRMRYHIGSSCTLILDCEDARVLSRYSTLPVPGALIPELPFSYAFPCSVISLFLPWSHFLKLYPFSCVSFCFRVHPASSRCSLPS